MAKIQDMILYAIEQEYKAADQIVNAIERAHAFFELTQACALALQTQGNTTIGTSTTIPAVTTTLVEEPKVVTRTRKSSKKQAPEPIIIGPVIEDEPVAEEPTVEGTVSAEEPIVTEEPVLEEPQLDLSTEESSQDIVETSQMTETTEDEDDEWTEERLIEMEDDLAEFNSIVVELSEYPSNTLGDLIRQATDGKCTSEKDIKPSNIRIVIAYIRAMQACATDNDEAEEE